MACILRRCKHIVVALQFFSPDYFTMNPGILYALCAYVIWGMFPIYFKSLQEIPPMEVLMYRMVWALVFLTIVLSVRKQWTWLGPTLRQPRVLLGFTASALLLSSNWFLYI